MAPGDDVRTKTIPALAVLALASIATPALANDWVLVTYGATDALGVDLDSIRVEGDRRIFWSVWVKKTTQAAEGTVPRHDYRVRRDTIDCRLNMISTGATGFYIIGANRPAMAANDTGRQNDIFPDSVADGLRDFVCEIGNITPIKGYGVETSEQFARDRRSGFLQADADWLSGALE